MDKNNNNQEAFFALVRAGLWGGQGPVQEFKKVDWGEVYRLAEEQSVVELVAAGIEELRAKNCRAVEVPQEWALQFIGQTLQIEQRNRAMNEFVAKLIALLRKNDIYAILVKGQGIAQCYEKPLWRASGDVDLLLSEDNYEKAKALLVPLATEAETEYTHFKHLGMTIDGWVVELHGTLHSRLSARVDRMIDAVQGDVFYGGQVRSVEFKSSNGSRVQVFLPAPDEDVIFVFTHILHHFFFEGIGLRQFCDLCRFLWTYREELNVTLLEKRLREMRLMTEWKTFAAFAVDYLGMPVEAMPLYSADKKWKRKGDQMGKFVMKVGNFGHNRELRAKNAELRASNAELRAKNAELRAKSCRTKGRESYFWRKFISFWGRLSDMLRHFSVFPLDSIRFFGGVLRSGLHAAVRGE